MKKDLILVTILIIILVVLGVVFRNPEVNKETKVDNTSNTIPITNEGLIVDSYFSTETLAISDPYVLVDIKYPAFKNVDKDFNDIILNLLKDKSSEHLKTSKENWQARYDTQSKGENIPKVPAKDSDKFSFYSNFTIVQSNSNYISFVLLYGGFTGGAHGYENNVSFNYDLKNKKIIELKDLFQNNSDYLKYLSDKSRESLKATFATVSEEDQKNSDPKAIKEYLDNMVSMIESGTEPKEENFSIFTFTPGKVKIYFAQYQVGPYVIGSPEVEIDIK